MLALFINIKNYKYHLKLIKNYFKNNNKLFKRKRKCTNSFMGCYFWMYIVGLYLFAQVSKAAAELMAYCESHAKEDPLVTPVPSSENPFREKKIFCTVL